MQKNNFKEIEKWMTFYYQNPQPDLVVYALQELSRKGILGKPDTSETIMFFFSFIFRSNPDKIDTWVSQLTSILTDTEKEVILTSIWLSDTAESEDYLTQFVSKYPAYRDFIFELNKEERPDLLELPIESPSMLDALWAAFMATGEDKYVVKIISALADIDHQTDEIKKLVARTAKWSLASNLKIHPKVERICKEQLIMESSKIREVLNEILAG